MSEKKHHRGLPRCRRAIRKLPLVTRGCKLGEVREGDTSQEKRTTNGRKRKRWFDIADHPRAGECCSYRKL